jgi:hypothetical protein
MNKLSPAELGSVVADVDRNYGDSRHTLAVVMGMTGYALDTCEDILQKDTFLILQFSIRETNLRG